MPQPQAAYAYRVYGILALLEDGMLGYSSNHGILRLPNDDAGDINVTEG